MTHERKGSKELPLIYLEQYDLGEITPEIIEELQRLFDHAYHNSSMYSYFLEDIEERPEVFKLIIARHHDSSNAVVGGAVAEAKEHNFIDYQGFPPVHVKRFTVLPEFRGMGVGRQLLDETKRYCFEELGLQAIFGESNETGALAMYGREGALYHIGSIENSLRRTSPEANVRHFRKFISDPYFRETEFRYPVGDGIQFVFCGDDGTAQFFRDHGYISQGEILSEKTES